MRVSFLALLLALSSGCKKSEPPPPAPKYAAICDYKSDITHTCTEVYDVAFLAETERWCAGLPAKYQKDAACPTDGQRGACRLPSGTAEFSYAPTTVRNAQAECLKQGGQFVADTTLPEAGPPSLYACTLVKSRLAPLDGTCLEDESVVELYNVSQTSCTNFGGKFTLGACPTAGSVGRCTTASHALRSTRVFYGERFDAGAARSACDSVSGTFAP